MFFKAKDLTFNAKDLSFKAKARNLKIVLMDSLRPGTPVTACLQENLCVFITETQP